MVSSFHYAEMIGLIPVDLTIAIFFPRFILYTFFLFLLIYGGSGFWGWGLILGFGVRVFS